MSADPNDSIKRIALVLESPMGLETMDLSRRLRSIGMPMQLAPDFEMAELTLQEPNCEVGVVFIPTHFDATTHAKNIARLLALAPPTGLGLISVGGTPDKAERKRLRKAGVHLALWNPIAEASLRFQVNRAIHTDRNKFGERDSARVPTDLTGTVTVGERTKSADVYSLAEIGAFLATKRSIMTGATLKVDLHLHDGSVQTTAEVVYANVPGNLQRPGLPLGMGIRFIDLARSDKKRLAEIVRAGVKRLEV